MAAMDTLMPGIRTGNFAPCRAGGLAGNHLIPVSYTHLDVYKRQAKGRSFNGKKQL